MFKIFFQSEALHTTRDLILSTFTIVKSIAPLFFEDLSVGNKRIKKRKKRKRKRRRKRKRKRRRARKRSRRKKRKKRRGRRRKKKKRSRKKKGKGRQKKRKIISTYLKLPGHVTSKGASCGAEHFSFKILTSSIMTSLV